ncbi:hypothetical protein [uncultured Fructobacillus sp.]|uniref:hypothetical protein n=1 Tax=uncultured Fructobacillus sp. TaxID=591942 RepID=UPI0025971A93|nr:hypothetical protein [uncultured Fructobacillus sp.]
MKILEQKKINKTAEYIAAIANILLVAEKTGNVQDVDRNEILSVISNLSIDIANDMGEAIYEGG